MKKTKLLFLAAGTALLAIPALVGCTGDGKTHVKFWHTMGQGNQDVLKRAIAEFQEKYPDVVIDHAAQGDYSALHEKLMSAIPAGTMPTMAFCYPDHVADYMASNAIVNIDDYLADEELKFNAEDGLKEDFVETYWEEGTKYEKTGTYSVPFAKSTEVLFYNATFFTKYASLISIPTTWDEMWETCRIIKEEIMDKGLEPGLEFPMGYDSDSNLFITMCEQNGIEYTTNDNVSKPADHIKFNNTDAKAMIDDLVVKYKAGYFATKNTLPNNSYTSTYFTEGKTVMSIGSTGGTSYNVSTNFDVRIAPAPVTANEGNKNKYILQGPSICFFKKGSDAVKKAAWNFYKYIVRAANTAAYGVKSGYEPVRKSAYDLDGYKEYLEGDSLQARVSKVTATIGDRFFLSPVFYGSASARDEVGNIFANVALNQKTTDQAFADAATVAIRACGN